MREISYFAAHGLNAGFVRTFYFPKQLYFNEITFPPQSPYSSQTGHGVAGMVLRNVAPRQGTETFKHFFIYPAKNHSIEKCSSPIGDGNSTHCCVCYIKRQLRNVAPRQGTETIYELCIINCFIDIEKCSSPIGDGNLCPSIAIITQVLLRNVAPRQGTETGCQNGRIIHAMTN